MNAYRRPKRTGQVREPVQVYLDGPDQERLERLTDRLHATKSDVLRRGLEALEHQISDPGRHPALRIAAMFEAAQVGDPAREHDRVLAESEEESWDGGDAG